MATCLQCRHPRAEIPVIGYQPVAIGSWQGGTVSDGTTIWFVDEPASDTAVAYSSPSLAQVVTSGTTYTTAGDTDGFVSQTLSGINNNQSFAITVCRRRLC